MSTVNARAVPSSRADMRCPSCAARDSKIFYHVESAPVHSVLQMTSVQMALEYPKRNIALALCRTCGVISNTVFDPMLHAYSADYEETQSYSATFRAFHAQLATNLIERYGIKHKTIIEIGCGKGDFLSLLCRLGDNRGIGIDPAFVPERNPASDCQVEFVREFYSERFSDYKADLIVCKMTLEHIYSIQEFVSLVRKSVDNMTETRVFFQVPDMDRILDETAVEDVYYEHCSYFTRESLSNLFVRCGFEILEIASEYSNQYLTLVAKPSDSSEATANIRVNTSELERKADAFCVRSSLKIARLKRLIKGLAVNGGRIVLWGSGSKAVALLTALRSDADIAFVVDINPYRQGHYMAGSGHRIVSPQQLAEEGADAIVAMNAVYLPEIRATMDNLGIRADLRAL
jgi:hypothetical protein